MLAAATAPPARRRRHRTDRRGGRGFRSSPSATRPGRGAARRCAGHQPLARRAWRFDGRGPRARVGGNVPRAARRCAVLACGAGQHRRTDRVCAGADAAIRQDPHFAGGDYYGGPAPEAGLGSPGGLPTSTTGRSRNWSTGSAARRRRRTPFGGMRRRPAAATRWKATWTTRARSWCAASTPTVTSLTEALMSHDVLPRPRLAGAVAGRPRSGILHCGGGFDRLYFPEQSRQLAEALPGRSRCTPSKRRWATTVS